MRHIFVVSLIILFSPLAGSAQRDGEEPQELEPITITGSRLERVDQEAPEPLVVFTREELLASGYGTVADFVDKLVYMYGPSGGDLGDVTERLDLRDIGGTLILVNGRRMVRFAEADFRGTPFQEISTIPVWAIERIEILKDGASALYGSDAITGVVNIILRRQYRGAEASLKYQSPSTGDSDEVQLGVTVGSGTERFNWMVSLTAFERDEALKGELDDRSEFFEENGILDLLSSNSGFPGSYVDPETFTVFPDPECPPDRLGFNFPATDFLDQPTCAIQKSQFATAERATERHGVHAAADYTMPSGLLFDAGLLVSERDTKFTQAPFSLFIFGNGSTFSRPIVPADHPFNPFGRQVEALITPLDIGLNVFDQTSETARYWLGASRKHSAFDWEASLIYEENEVEGVLRNAIDGDRVQAALQGEGGPSGDLLYNPFGLDPDNPPELLEWLAVDREPSTGTSNLWLADFMVRGELAKWRSAPLQYAAGLEYHELAVENQTVDEDRDVIAAFVEVGIPAFEGLDVQLAARSEHYSDFGTTTNPKLALFWRPLSEWAVRASWSTSFRAPSLENLHREPPPGRFTFIEDPIRCPVTESPLDCGEVPVDFLRKGNPNLEAEEGESLYIGLIWEPRFIAGLSAELGLWDFEYTDQVVNPPRFVLLQRTDDPDIFIRAEPTQEDEELGLPGRLIAFVDQPLNGDNAFTQGIDLEVDYATSLGGDELQLRWATSYQSEQERFRLGFEGTPIQNGGQFKPDLQSRLDVIWGRGVHEVIGTVYYQDSFVYRGFTPEFSPIDFEVGDWTTLDLQYRFNWRSRNSELRLGCKNCLDNDAPVSAAPSGIDFNHDGRGLILYAQVEWRLGN